MKKGIVFLFLITAMLFISYGIRDQLRQDTNSLPLEKQKIQKALSKFHPLLEDKQIVTIVLAENAEKYVERNLTSIFDQNYANMRVIYVDNGSTDKTYEVAKSFLEKKSNRKKYIMYRMEEKKPAVEVLYEVIRECPPNEIITLIDGIDWLAHENVFDHLNCAYANSNVWMTYSRSISHPDYHQIKGHALSDRMLMEKKLRKEKKEWLPPLVTFYAGFFHEIKLQDLLYQGSFIDECKDFTMQIPLIEMGAEHILFMDEVSYVQNNNHGINDHNLQLNKRASVNSHLRSLCSYPSLNNLKLIENVSEGYKYKSDLILFSEDSPLHLYACLESLYLNVHDINKIFVLYSASDRELQRAYLNLQNEHHSVQFFNICDYPGNDFASLTTEVLSNRRYSSPYVTIGDDWMIFDKQIKFHDCIKALEKVHCDYLFLNFEEKESSSPKTISISSGIYARQLGEKGSDQSLAFILFRKSFFETLSEVRDFPALKQYWKDQLHKDSVALFFKEKKMFPMDYGKDITLIQKKEWGRKFIEGYKIDLTSIPCEVDEVQKGDLPFIKRKKHGTIDYID